jgi:hypothetical protein
MMGHDSGSLIGSTLTPAGRNCLVDAMPKQRKAPAEAASAAYSELEPVAAWVDNINDEYAVALAEAMDLILSQDEFLEIMTANPIGIAKDAGVSEADAGSKAGILTCKALHIEIVINGTKVETRRAGSLLPRCCCSAASKTS